MSAKLDAGYESIYAKTKRGGEHLTSYSRFNYVDPPPPTPCFHLVLDIHLSPLSSLLIYTPLLTNEVYFYVWHEW